MQEYYDTLLQYIPHFLLTSFVLTIFLYVLLHIILHRKKLLIQYVWFFCFTFYLQILYLTTLGLSPGIHATRHKPNFLPFIDIIQVYSMGLRKMLQQILINTLLLLPLGFMLPIQFCIFQSFHRTFFIVFAVSLLIEICQYFIGRSADIDDVIFNTVGGILGYLCFMLYKKIANRSVPPS